MATPPTRTGQQQLRRIQQAVGAPLVDDLVVEQLIALAHSQEMSVQDGQQELADTAGGRRGTGE